MHTTKSRKLIGPVDTVEREFAVFETVEGNAIEARHENAGKERYDRDGRLLEEISADRILIDQVYRDDYLYNSNGDLTEHREYDDEGSLIGKHVFEPGPDQGRISRSYYVGSNNELVLFSLQHFDHQGELLDATRFDETGNVMPKSRDYPVTKTITRQTDDLTANHVSSNSCQIKHCRDGQGCLRPRLH